MNKILKYNQAKYLIFDLIIHGRLKVGDKLPSLRTMASLFPFSEISIRRALDELEEQGYVTKRHGSGIFLAKEMDKWEKRGTMLYLQVDPITVSIAPEVTRLKQYLRDRLIQLDAISCSKPGGEVIDASRECIGIFVSGTITDEWVDFLSTLGKPILYIGSDKATRSKPCVCYDWGGGVRLAMERLLRQGCKRIALITGDENWYPSHLIAEAYLEQAKRLGLEIGAEDILWKTTFRGVEVRDFLKSRPSYDAFILESGALSHLLVCSRQDQADLDAPIIVLGSLGDHYSTDRIAFVGFQGDVFVEAGKTFFESLNDLDYFRNGPKLITPAFIPEGPASSATKAKRARRST